MPARKILLATNNIYHVLNKGFRKKPIFKFSDDSIRTLELLNYYRFKNIFMPFSHLQGLKINLQTKILNKLKDNAKQIVNIISFCLMPNHFHILLKQKEENGIRIFLTKFQNGFAKYFNIKYKRSGPVFDGRFKAVPVNNNYQLLHISRYIHLNPYSSSIVTSKKELLDYKLSSLSEYLGKNKGFCQKEIILKQFSNQKDYQNFVLNQANYQKKLNKIKHLILE